MTVTDDNAWSSWSEGWGSRLKRSRLVVVGAAAVFAALWLIGTLAVVPASVGFAVIAVVAAIAAGRGEAARGVSSPDVAPMPGAHDKVLDAVLAALPEPVIALAGSGDVIAFNAHTAAIAPALRRGEPVSLGLRNPGILNALRRARASGAIQRVEFFDGVPADRWYEAVVIPIPAGAGLSAGIMLMAFRDLTPLRRVEEMRADFIANASHELRTPLAALSGFIETLRGPAREDGVAREKFLGIMQAQAGRMARLIDDLLSLSRIELNAHLRPDRQTDLVAIVRQVVDGLQMLARDRGVEVKVAAPAGPLVVLGDRDELLRVFENLVENALKYAGSGKLVEVTLEEAEGTGGVREARVSVRDHGPGIAPEHLPRLTERFYRVDVVHSRAEGGTGLGLALAKHILNRHGGRLTIESVLGQGATFTAHLPLADPGKVTA